MPLAAPRQILSLDSQSREARPISLFPCKEAEKLPAATWS
uniref:Uncharacterized protein n=1 Tax=Rhizophora mucronata TaxID=61149 RepID=A0A2P2Q8I5_RHIMU